MEGPGHQVTVGRKLLFEWAYAPLASGICEIEADGPADVAEVNHQKPIDRLDHRS
jgi:hypothetical protein